MSNKITSTISVPLCYLPNSLCHVFNPGSKFSKFQAEFLKSITEIPDFAYFVSIGSVSKPFENNNHIIMYPSEYCIMFYNKTGDAFAVKFTRKIQTTPITKLNKVSRDDRNIEAILRVRCA